MKLNLPNKLSMLRIFLVPVIIIIQIIEGIDFDSNPFRIDLFLGVSLGNLLVLIIFIIASFTDYLDGHIARRDNLITDFGKFIDPLADKLLVCSTFIYLIQVGRLYFFNMSFVFLVTIIIAREFAVTGLRLMLAKKSGEVVAAKMLGKLKTVSQMIAIIVLLLNSFSLPIIGFILIVLCTILSVVSGIDYFVKSKGKIMNS